MVSTMSTLAEIEAAADTLSKEDKESLLRFLAVRLREEHAGVSPRIYADEEVAAMLAEDNADRNIRQAGLHAGAWEVADDFDAPLPEGFWLGEDA